MYEQRKVKSTQRFRTINEELKLVKCNKMTLLR